MNLEFDDYLTASRFARHRLFWQQQFDISPEVFEFSSALLFDKEAEHTSLSHATVTLDEFAEKTVRRISRQTDQGIFVVIAAAFCALLGRLAGADTITLGLPSGSALPGEQGPLLFVPVLRDKPVKDLLAHLSSAIPACEAHRDFPVGAFAKALDRHVGTDVLIASEAIHGPLDADRVHNLSLSIRTTDSISLALASPNGSIPAWFLTTLGTLLNETLTGFDVLDRTLESVHAGTRDAVLHTLAAFNRTETDFAAGWVQDNGISDATRRATVIDLFERRAAGLPDATALICGDVAMSYAQLDEQATRLAHSLVSRMGIATGKVVASFNTRSHWAIVSLLAILKTGATFLPLSPKLPQQHIARIMSESEVSAIVADSTYLDLLSGAEETPVYAIDLQLPNAPAPTAVNASMARAEGLAYIVYTSGTTGQSKGVMLAHRGLTNTVLEHIERFAMTPDDRYLQFMAISFDGFLLDTFSTLCAGATLVIADDETIADPSRFMSYGEQHRATISTITPSYLQLLDPERLPSLRILVSAGEALSRSLVQRYAHRLALFNGYGPSEATINSTLHAIDPAKASAVNIIGGPGANKQIFVMDPYLQPLPIGSIGEICIAGEGLALGYVADQALTDQKFVDCPFGNHGRIYRSGDFGAWTPEGTLLFKGRTDSQLKVNGLRIDLSEIDRALQACAGLHATHVMPRQSSDGHTEICAFYERTPRMELVPSLGEYGIYDVFLYESMATDKVRVDGYRHALARRVAGKVVLDPGTGSEIVLARHCIEAGAKRVYAVEIDEDAYRNAQENIQRYGLSDQIILVKGDVTTAQSLPEPVDVVVSALAGNIASADGCLCVMQQIKRSLAAPVSFVPNRYITRIAGFELSDAHVETGLSEISVHYFHELFGKYEKPFDARLCVQNLQHEFILTETGHAEDIDYGAELRTDDVAELSLKVLKHGRLSGFVLWLNAFCDDELMIDSSEKTHHLPVYLPITADTALTVEAGDQVVFRFIRSLGADGLHPDYRIEGVVRNPHGNDRPFSCDSPHAPLNFRDNELYKRLFAPDGTPAAMKRITPTTIRETLQQRLPTYLIPHRFVEVAEWPRTMHGKIDARALLDLASTSDLNKENYAAAETPLQSALCEIWCEVLEQPTLGIDDNVFSMGCDSIRVIQAVHLAREQGIRVESADVMAYQTVRALAARIQSHLVQNESSSVDDAKSSKKQIPLELAAISADESAALPADVLDAYPASAMQLMMLDAYTRDRRLDGIYHCCAVWHFADATLDEDALVAAAQHLYDTHTSLRTFFVKPTGGRVLQAIRRQHRLTVTRVDLTKTDGVADDVFFTQQIQADIADRFDPYSPDAPLVRIKLWRTSASHCALLFSFHHAILDGWSGVELRNALADHYVTFKNGSAPSLPDIQADSRKEFVSLELAACSDSTATAYWENQFASEAAQRCVRPANLIPRPPSNGDRRGFATFARAISPDVLQAAQAGAQHLGVQLKAVFLSAFVQSLSQTLRTDAFSTGVVTNGRSAQMSAPLSATGLFWNIVPLILGASDDVTPQAMQQRLNAIEAIGHYPLREIERRFVGEPLLLPTFNFVNFHNLKTQDAVDCREGLVNDRFHFPLNFFVATSSSTGTHAGLFRVEFDRDYFTTDAIENLIEMCSQSILSAIVSTY